MTSSTRRRLAGGIGAGIAAAAALGTLAISAASANSDVTPPAGITVPGNSAGAPATLVASLEGRNEVNPGAPQGQALELIGIQGNTLSYSVSWRGIGTPTAADIHAGARGVDGPVVVPLFTTPRPAGGFASGTVTVTDPTLLDALRSNPQGFYADLHTTTFPDGAARAQLHALNHTVATSGVAALQESVIFGSQIYACTVQTDGLFAFTQHDVEARLSGGIHHTFVRPLAGVPQWQAPDGSPATRRPPRSSTSPTRPTTCSSTASNIERPAPPTSTGRRMAIPEVGVVGRGGWPRPRRPAPPKRGSLQSSTAPICHGFRP